MAEEKKNDQKQGREFKLRYPVEYEGKKYESLNMDFSSLTAEDIINAESQFVAETGTDPFVKETRKMFQAYVAARAAGVSPDMIKKMNASDFSRLTVRVQNFLLGVGSDE